MSNSNLPTLLKGDFTDDYDIHYSISDSLWIQHPAFEMKITKIDTTVMYILGYDTNDSTYTRIDYMPFKNMGDYTWGFCYTAYEQEDEEALLDMESANRDTPKTGCGGFPFSRMKRMH